MVSDKASIDRYKGQLDAFIGDLQAEKLAPGTINNHVKGVKALLRANGVEVVLPHRLSKRVVFSDRSPTPEELTRALDLGDIAFAREPSEPPTPQDSQ